VPTINILQNNDISNYTTSRLQTKINHNHRYGYDHSVVIVLGSTHNMKSRYSGDTRSTVKN